MVKEFNESLHLVNILAMIKKLNPYEQLQLISKIAENLSMQKEKKRPHKPISAYEFCGMWADRPDMENSLAWVQQLRQKEETRSSHG